MVLDTSELRRIQRWVQDGVVSRRQILSLGGSDADVARMVRRKELVRVHPGVFVHHTGPLSEVQRQWAAVLACWPAALCHESALPRPRPSRVVHVAVDDRRTVRPVPGVRVHRMTDFQARVNWIPSPPRQWLPHAAIDVAIGCRSIDDVFTIFAEVLQSRETSVREIETALASRKRVPCRRLLQELLRDLAAGANSVLEREYLRLERRHGLPTARRQVRDCAGERTVVRDVLYEEFGLAVELDGRAFHDTADARDLDADRDLAAAVSSALLTVRLTHGQVFRDGCSTIARIGALLRRRGWAGAHTPCPTCATY